MTEQELEKRILYKQVFYPGDKTIVVLIKLTNGNEFIGRSAVFKEEDFDRIKGEFLAYQDALKQVRKIEANSQAHQWNNLKEKMETNNANGNKYAKSTETETE